MRNKWYWGLAAFIILLGTAFIVITIRDRAEIAQPKRDRADLQKMKAESNQPQTPEVVVGQQSPQGASPDGHWHDGKWHDEPHAGTLGDVDELVKAPENWMLPIPEGSDPRNINIEAIQTLRKKVFSGLNNSEVHRLKLDTLKLLPTERELFEFARYAELYSRHPGLAQAWQEVKNREQEARTLWGDRLVHKRNIK